MRLTALVHPCAYWFGSKSMTLGQINPTWVQLFGRNPANGHSKDLKYVLGETSSVAYEVYMAKFLMRLKIWFQRMWYQILIWKNFTPSSALNVQQIFGDQIPYLIKRSLSSRQRARLFSLTLSIVFVTSAA